MTLLTIVALVGSLFSASYFFSIEDLYYASGNEKGVRYLRVKSIPQHGSLYIAKDKGICDIGYGIEQYNGTIVNPNSNPLNGCQMKAATLRKYEDNNCDGSVNPGRYKLGHRVKKYYVQDGVATYLQQSSEGTYYRIPFRYNPNDDEKGNAGTISLGYQCKNEVATGGSRQWTLVVLVANDSANQCPYTTDQTCNNCAWPYVAKADTMNCGCKVDYTQYQSQTDLEKYAYAYCQTAGNDGSQYTLDRSRSNFDAALGEIYGACTSTWTRNTIYISAGTCPAPIADTAITTTGAQAITNPIPPTKETGGRGGSGVDTGTHTRLDSILGLINDGRDADSIAGLPDSNSWDSVQSAATGVQADIDSLQVGRARTGGPWSATVPYPDTIEMRMDVPVFGTVIDTALVVDWEIPGFPFDLWALFRWIEWVFVTMAMIPLFVRIAGGNEDS